ncbi:MAG: M56 family metallopeptidase [Terriglobales bacterium]
MSPALPYWLRLLCLSLGAGAFSYAAGLLAASVLAPALLRRLDPKRPLPPARAARWLLGLRLLPAALAAMVVGGLCVPSYIWLEPVGRAERGSWGFSLAAAGGAVLVLLAVARLAAAAIASRRFCRRCRQIGRIFVVPGAAPMLALAGIVRPRLLISRSVLARLSPAQLQAGLLHERAHLRARDNLKRLLMILTPAPGAGFRALERAWVRAAEWAADDRAVAGDSQRSLTLASALVAVARLGPCAPIPPVAALLVHASLAGDGADLAERVSRLLAPPAAPYTDAHSRVWAGWTGLSVLVWAMLQPTTLLAAHRLLERLVR